MSFEGSAEFVILDSTGSNWNTWQTTAKFELKSHKVWKYFDPSNPFSSPPTKYSTEDLAQVKNGADPSNLTILSLYTAWGRECNVAIACLARLVHPIHASLLDRGLPKECWEALVKRFANRSVKDVMLIRTKLASLKFSDDNSIPLTNFLAGFNMLLLDLKCAGYPLSDSETCLRLALAMPLSLQPMVSTLQEGQNATKPHYWYQALSTTWERLQIVRANEEFFCKQTSTTSSSPFRDCFTCKNPGHHARNCPTLCSEEGDRRQEKAQERKQAQRFGRSKGNEDSSDIATQLSQIQARLAALNTYSDPTYETYGYAYSHRILTPI